MEFIAVLVAILEITAVVAYLLGRNTARTEILSRHAALKAENLRVCHELDSSCRTINNLREQLAQMKEHCKECEEEYEQTSQRYWSIEDEVAALREELFQRYLRCASLNVHIANCYAETFECCAETTEKDAGEPDKTLRENG